MSTSTLFLAMFEDNQEHDKIIKKEIDQLLVKSYKTSVRVTIKNRKNLASDRAICMASHTVQKLISLCVRLRWIVG